MPLITALLYTENDGLRLGRALETLYPCDEILIVDHNSRDATIRIALEYGAHIVTAKPGVPPVAYLANASGWFFCLSPRESLTEALAASLFEWKSAPAIPSASAFSVLVREETNDGWIDLRTAQTRLVPITWNRWHQGFPIAEPAAAILEGELLRFALP